MTQHISRSRRTGGRSARVRTAVLDAAMAVLLQSGFEKFSIADVAKRSGVHETSIYRRWGTKAALLVDALIAHFEEAVPVPDTGRLQEDVVQLLNSVLNALKSSVGIAIIRMVAGPAGATAEVKTMRDLYWKRRHRDAVLVLKRAVERGELPKKTNLDLLLDTLIGTLYVRALITNGPLSKKLPEQVADLVLQGAITPNKRYFR